MRDPYDLSLESPAPAAAPLVAAGMPPLYLDGLNPAQRAAVEATDGPVLVLAGAGTGKTRVLTTRLVHILAQGLARPWQVLSVTFTNKAAREMRERVTFMVGPVAEAIWLGTFHALGAKILRRHAELVGLKPNFSILDDDDQQRLLKQILAAEGIDDKKWPARLLLGVIGRWKDRGLTPENVTRAEAGDLAGGRLLQLYHDYQARLLAVNACDFGDLLLHVLTIFGKHPEVLADYQEQFRYILVDEYQDTNVAQYLWLRLLAQKHKNLACVGDDDQSIYAWRGAEVGNILRFEQDFPGAKIVRLEQNYRSTPHILAAASGLIAKNRGRLGKSLWTNVEAGEKVSVRGVWDGEEEARAVGEEIERQQRKGASLRTMAVLVRAGAQTREFEERFLKLGLPYRVIGGARFYERQEVRDALAYLRLIHQPDDGLAFERIINKPKRGLGDATVSLLHQASRAAGISLLAAAEHLVATDEIKPAARRSLVGFLKDHARWRGLLETMPHPELAGLVLDESGYTGMLQADRAPEAPGRLENLKELVTAMAEFENLAGFLEHVSLVMENVEAAGTDAVSLMTLHGAKGLEFDTVFLPGWEEGLFPHQRNIDENGEKGLEEERRLAYVGLTRAKVRAFVSFAANRRLYGGWTSTLPSRFIRELPSEHIAIETAPGLNIGGRGTPEAPRRWGSSSAVIEARAEPITRRTPPDGGYDAGDRVFHVKFGYGTVKRVETDRLEIDFDKAGVKKVLDGFVQPADSV
ncbi:MAG: DNA helicase II [Alphaproteobacteria bacterium]|nr:DNA helicase II [Alphaproteobacteria bacterium]